MSDRTGLGPIEVGILEACDRADALPGTPHKATTRVLDEIYDHLGIGPRIAYDVLCEMARPDLHHLVLIDFLGNCGSRDFGPAAAQYTEVCLSAIGAAVLASERGELGPLPVGLINGDIHVGGKHPPFNPHRVTMAMQAVETGIDDDALGRLVGRPDFCNGCTVDGDIERLLRGEVAQLQASAVITQAESNCLVISGLPPDIAGFDICSAIHDQPRNGNDRGDIREVNDETVGHETRIVVRLFPNRAVHQTAEFLGTLWCMSRPLSAQLDKPIGQLIRDTACDRSDLDRRLAIIAAAVRGNT